MNEKALELKLLQNPNYSSGWIQNAVPLMAKYSLTEEQLVKYDVEQLQLITAMFAEEEKGYDILVDEFLNPALNATQMQLLLTGYSKGLTTEQLRPFFNPEIPYVKSNWYITALIEGIDLTDYDINAYDMNQIYEIYAGKKDGVDVSVYNKVDVPAEKMAIAHHALAMGLKVQFDENKKLTIY